MKFPTTPPSHHAKRSRFRRRRAIATVELALVLPVMLIIVFGTLEICQRLMIRQTAAVAAYETARLAARRTSTVIQAKARGEQIMTDRRIIGGEVEITPNQLALLPTGSEVQVTVRIPVAGNTTVNYLLPTTGEIRIVTTMLRE
jgi:Flp pilus assembly protein TadG